MVSVITAPPSICIFTGIVAIGDVKLFLTVIFTGTALLNPQLETTGVSMLTI
jgi:hypothetical protein